MTTWHRTLQEAWFVLLEVQESKKRFTAACVSRNYDYGNKRFVISVHIFPYVRLGGRLYEWLRFFAWRKLEHVRPASTICGPHRTSNFCLLVEHCLQATTDPFFCLFTAPMNLNSIFSAERACSLRLVGDWLHLFVANTPISLIFMVFFTYASLGPGWLPKSFFRLLPNYACYK